MYLKSVALIACVGSLSTEAVAQSNNRELRSLLPAGALAVEVLSPWSPQRLALLTSRVQQAAAANPGWFRTAAAAAAPGRPMAYDARLGLSREEYDELLALTDSVTVRPSGTGTVVVESTPFGWRLASTTSIPSLRGLEVDTVASVVRTTFGELASGSPIRPSAAQKATGPWQASRWELTTLDSQGTTGVSATFAIGRFVDTRRGILYLNARRLQGGAVVERADLFLRLSP